MEEASGPAAVTVGLRAIAVIRALSGNVAIHGASHSRHTTAGMTKAICQLTPMPWTSQASTSGPAITDPSWAPALNSPPAFDRLDAGKSPASALMPAV